MALFKHFRGTRASLAAQELHDGYAYFCVDDGTFHIDCLDSEGQLQRKQINAKEAETLGLHTADEFLLKTDLPQIGGEGENTLIQGSTVANQALGNSASAFGFGTIAGSKCFTIIAVDPTTNTYTLDFDPATEEGVKLNTALTEVIGEEYSAHLGYLWNDTGLDGSRQRERYGKITAVDGNKVTVDVFFDVPSGTTFHIDETYLDEDGVDNEVNTFRITTHPLVGNRIIGVGATTKGWYTKATGKGGYAEGVNSIAHGSYGHAENKGTKAGYAAHAEGENTEANGLKSHAQNWNTKALGEGSDSFGRDTVAVTTGSSAGGYGSIAGMNWIPCTLNSVATEVELGFKEDLIDIHHCNVNLTLSKPLLEDITITIEIIGNCLADLVGDLEITIPANTTEYNLIDYTYGAPDEEWLNATFKDGDNFGYTYVDQYSAKIIRTTSALDLDSADGLAIGDTISLLNTSKLNAYLNVGTIVAIDANAIEVSSLPEDLDIAATYKVAVLSKPNLGSYITGRYASTSGHETKAFGDYSEAHGERSVALGMNSTATGLETKAIGKNSIATGEATKAIGKRAVATGLHTIAYGNHSVAEGNKGVAFGSGSHVQGQGHSNNQYSGEFTAKAIAEAWENNEVIAATGSSSFATGVRTLAAGTASTTFGNHTRANNANSIAAGQDTIANADNQVVVGKYNETSSDALFIVGNGDSSKRANAFAVDKDGNTNISGNLNVATINGAKLEAATSTQAGLLSAEDKKYIDGIKDNLNVSGAVTATNITASNSLNAGSDNIVVGNQAGALGKKNSTGMQWVKVDNIIEPDISDITVDFTQRSWNDEGLDEWVDEITYYLETIVTFSRVLPLGSQVTLRINYKNESSASYWHDDHVIIGDNIKNSFKFTISTTVKPIASPSGSETCVDTIEIIDRQVPSGHVLELANTSGFAKDQIFSIYQNAYQKGYYNCGTITAVAPNSIMVDSLPEFTDMSNSDKTVYIGIASKADLKNSAAKVYGDFSLSVGQDNVIGANNSGAIGSKNVVLGNTSVAAGTSNKVLARNSSAAGSANEINEGFGFASGEKNFINHKWASASGRENRTGANYQTIVGKYNEQTDGLFVVGNGSADNSRSNAFVVRSDSNGNATALLGKENIATESYVNDAVASIDVISDWSDITSKPYIERGEGSCSVITTGTSTTSQPNTAKGEFSRAGGRSTKSLGRSSTTEGIHTIATGNNAFATGDKGLALGSNAFVVGSGIQYTGEIPYKVNADGKQTNEVDATSLAATIKDAWDNGTNYHAAIGAGSSVLGRACLAPGTYSIAAGERARANGSKSFAFGYNVTATGNEQTVVGKFNVEDNKALFVVGNGKSANEPGNAFKVNADGTATIGADPVNNLDVATKEYVDNNSCSLPLSGHMPEESINSSTSIAAGDKAIALGDANLVGIHYNPLNRNYIESNTKNVITCNLTVEDTSGYNNEYFPDVYIYSYHVKSDNDLPTDTSISGILSYIDTNTKEIVYTEAITFTFSKGSNIASEIHIYSDSPIYTQDGTFLGMGYNFEYSVTLDTYVMAFDMYTTVIKPVVNYWKISEYIVGDEYSIRRNGIIYEDIGSITHIDTDNQKITIYGLLEPKVGDDFIIFKKPFNGNLTSGDNSFSIGYDNRVLHNCSAAFGTCNQTSRVNQFVTGLYNDATSDGLLVVGNGSKDSRSNAFVVHHDGTATIGKDPINALDVATKQYVDSKTFDIDLTGYATEKYVDQQIDESWLELSTNIGSAEEDIRNNTEEIAELKNTLNDVKTALQEIINLQNALLGVNTNGDEVSY